MKTTDTESGRLNADACLAHIEALQGAVLTALLALGDGSLEELEDSLWKQQLLCATLQHSLDQLRCGTLDKPAVDRVLSAMNALHALNRTYSSAIDQATLSTELLWKLSETYGGSDARYKTDPQGRESARSSLCMA